MRAFFFKALLSCIFLALSMRSLAANLDNAAWLIYDVSYGDYFLLRIEMETAKTGHANVAGGNRYAGRRFTDQYGRFDVAMLDGRMTLYKDGAKPFMVGTINSTRDEFAGEFVKEDGSSAGRFVGALQGFTTYQMDLFQLCKQGGDDHFQCVNRGRDQRCDSGSYREKSTFFTEENCIDASDVSAGGFLAAPTEEPEQKFSEDPTGTWLFYDDKYKEYVVGRLVATNTDEREPGGNFKGTFVFSGVYYGWDEPEGFFNPHKLYFGRREIGRSAYKADERDKFYIRLDEGEIRFVHGYGRTLFGKVDLAAGKMAGDFTPGDRDLTFGDYESFGSGYWTAEKKSDDPNFDLPVYQYCSVRHDEEDPRLHYCPKVSDVKADGTERPSCAIGYSGGSITFLNQEGCVRLLKARQAKK